MLDIFAHLKSWPALSLAVLSVGPSSTCYLCPTDIIPGGQQREGHVIPAIHAHIIARVSFVQPPAAKRACLWARTAFGFFTLKRSTGAESGEPFKTCSFSMLCLCGPLRSAIILLSKTSQQKGEGWG